MRQRKPFSDIQRRANSESQIGIQQETIQSSISKHAPRPELRGFGAKLMG